MFKEIQNYFFNKLELYEKDDVFSTNSNNKTKSNNEQNNTLSTSKYKNSLSKIKSKVGDMKKHLKESAKKKTFNNKKLIMSRGDDISLTSMFPYTEFRNYSLDVSVSLYINIIS